MECRLLFSIALLALTNPACEVPGRPQNNLEITYAAIAVNLRDPSLCYKIAPDSYRKASMNSAGEQIVLTRSNCFYQVAILRGDTSLCDEVRTVSTPFLDGSAVSPETCRANAARTPTPRYTISGVQCELVTMLLGDLPPVGAAPEHILNERYYRALGSTTFLQRAARLPDLSQGDAEIKRQLNELAPQCTTASTDRLCQLLDCALRRDGIGECYQGIRPRSVRC